MKRVFDFTVSLLLLFILLPILFIIAFSVLINLGNPVLFTQMRIGKDNKVIRLFKFRTMTNKVDSQGKLLSNEKRVTRFGAFLRKSSLDELPSLFNVLIGELSLVGPRPLLTDYLPFYKTKHRVRHNVRPGITGLAQINGRNSTTWQKRLDYDVEYVENHSFSSDFKICISTFFKVIKSEGVEGNNDLSIIRLDQDKEYLESSND